MRVSLQVKGIKNPYQLLFLVNNTKDQKIRKEALWALVHHPNVTIEQLEDLEGVAKGCGENVLNKIQRKILAHPNAGFNNFSSLILHGNTKEIRQMALKSVSDCSDVTPWQINGLVESCVDKHVKYSMSMLIVCHKEVTKDHLCQILRRATGNLFEYAIQKLLRHKDFEVYDLYMLIQLEDSKGKKPKFELMLLEHPNVEADYLLEVANNGSMKNIRAQAEKEYIDHADSKVEELRRLVVVGLTPEIQMNALMALGEDTEKDTIDSLASLAERSNISMKLRKKAIELACAHESMSLGKLSTILVEGHMIPDFMRAMTLKAYLSHPEVTPKMLGNVIFQFPLPDESVRKIELAWLNHPDARIEDYRRLRRFKNLPQILKVNLSKRILACEECDDNDVRWIEKEETLPKVVRTQAQTKKMEMEGLSIKTLEDLVTSGITKKIQNKAFELFLKHKNATPDYLMVHDTTAQLGEWTRPKIQKALLDHPKIEPFHYHHLVVNGTTNGIREKARKTLATPEMQLLIKLTA